MGRYPVVFVSLKDVDGLTYDLARSRLAIPNEEALQNDGRVNITAYGIAFHKKRCRVAVMNTVSEI